MEIHLLIDIVINYYYYYSKCFRYFIHFYTLCISKEVLAKAHSVIVAQTQNYSVSSLFS